MVILSWTTYTKPAFIWDVFFPPQLPPGWTNPLRWMDPMANPIRLLETPRRSIATSKLMESKTSNERPPNRRWTRWLRGCCCWSWLVAIRGLGEYVVSKKGWDLNYVGGRYVDFPVFLLGGVRVFEGRKGGVLRCLKTVGGKARLTHFGAYAQRPNWEFIFSACRPPSKFEWNFDMDVLKMMDETINMIVEWFAWKANCGTLPRKKKQLQGLDTVDSPHVSSMVCKDGISFQSRQPVKPSTREGGISCKHQLLGIHGTTVRYIYLHENP